MKSANFRHLVRPGRGRAALPAALLAALLAGASPGWAQYGAQNGALDIPPTLSVEAEGVATAVPDMATVVLGVMYQAKTAREALDAMNADLARVLARLEEAGIEARDMRTSGLDLRPVQRDYSRSNSDGPEVVGFVAASDITVRVRDLAGLGPLLDTVVDDGANLFRGLQFGVSDPQPLEDAARRAAVAEARRRAALHAEAAGVALGPLLTLTEVGGGRPGLMRAEMAMDSGPGSVPLAPGEVTFTARVNMTYAIAPE